MTVTLVVLNAVLAAAAVATAFVGLRTIKSSNDVAAAAKAQSKTMRDELAVTNDQLELDRQALQSSVKPLLIGSMNEDGKASFEVTVTAGEQRLRLTFLNIGQGPAIVHGAFVTLGPGNVCEADPEHIVVPRDSLVQVWVKIPVSVNWGSAANEGRLAFAVKYSDLSGNQRTQTNVAVKVVVDTPYLHRIELYSCDENWITAELQVASG